MPQNDYIRLEVIGNAIGCALGLTRGFISFVAENGERYSIGMSERAFEFLFEEMSSDIKFRKGQSGQNTTK